MAPMDSLEHPWAILCPTPELPCLVPKALGGTREQLLAGDKDYLERTQCPWPVLMDRAG